MSIDAKNLLSINQQGRIQRRHVLQAGPVRRMDVPVAKRLRELKGENAKLK